MRPLLAAALLALSLAAPAAAEAPTLTLDAALAEAARANADLLSARADVDVSLAGHRASRANVLPRLDLQNSWGHEYVGGPFASASTGVSYPGNYDSEIYTLNLQLTQPLFDRQRFAAIDQAGWSVRAAERDYDEAALSLAFRVTQRFYEAVKQERSLAVLEKTAARSQELVERADALFTAGRAPKSDTFSARVNLQNDRINVEAARLRVAQARTALAQALGRPGAEELAVAAPAALDAPELPGGEPPPLEALVARARARRPTVAAEASRVEAARAGVDGARAGYLPSLSAQGTYTRSGAQLGGRDGIYGDPGRSYDATAQVVLSWNLFQGLGTGADVQRAEGAAARARVVARRTQETVAQEVADARAAVVALGRQAALAADSLSVARDALRLATERFAAGLASQLEERDANLKLSQAELTLVQTRIDHAVAVADLARAAGGAL